MERLVAFNFFFLWMAVALDGLMDNFEKYSHSGIIALLWFFSLCVAAVLSVVILVMAVT